MIITQLIKSLEEFKEKHGDLPLAIHCEDKEKPLEETDIYVTGIVGRMLYISFEFDGHKKGPERLERQRKEALKKWNDYNEAAIKKYQESKNNDN
jgi:hypothetical protein